MRAIAEVIRGVQGISDWCINDNMFLLRNLLLVGDVRKAMYTALPWVKARDGAPNVGSFVVTAKAGPNAYDGASILVRICMLAQPFNDCWPVHALEYAWTRSFNFG